MLSVLKQNNCSLLTPITTDFHSSLSWQGNNSLTSLGDGMGLTSWWDIVSTRLVTGAHIYFITLWQSSDGLKEADWDTDFFFFLPCLDFCSPWSFCTPLLSPSGACCYRYLAGWFNCLYWDTDTFQLFSYAEEEPVKRFFCSSGILMMLAEGTVTSLLSLNSQDCSLLSEAVYSAQESANGMIALWNTSRHSLDCLKISQGGEDNLSND